MIQNISDKWLLKYDIDLSKLYGFNTIQWIERMKDQACYSQMKVEVYHNFFNTHQKNDIALDLNLFQPLRPYLFFFHPSPIFYSFFVLRVFGISYRYTFYFKPNWGQQNRTCYIINMELVAWTSWSTKLRGSVLSI